MVLSASSLNAITFDMPRHAPTLMGQIHDDYAGEIGTMWVDVLNPLTSLSASDPVIIPVTVFASFKNPNVTGYGYTPVAPSRLSKMIKSTLTKKDFKKQSNNDPIAKETADKSKGGVISSFFDSIGNLGPAISASPFPEFSPIASLASAGAAFAKSIGFSKPVSQIASSTSVIDPFRDVNHGHGLSNANKLSLHPDAHISEGVVCELKKNSLLEMIKTPCLIKTGSMDYATATDSPIISVPVNPSLCAATATDYVPTHLAYMSQFFKSYRGGMKFHFHFVGSPFVTTRVRFSHFPSSDIPTSFEEYAGDIVSAVVDIRGDTHFDFTIPYMGAMPYTPTNGYFTFEDSYSNVIDPRDQNSFLVMSLVNPVVQGNSDGIAVIYYNVWVSAADDFYLNKFLLYNDRPRSGEIAPPEFV
jgi:hypothetical protein